MSDFIIRQDAIDAVLELSDKLANEMLFIDAIVDEIENLPSAEPKPERKKGQWIIRYFDMETYEYKEKVYNYYEKMPEGDVYCSECKESALLNGHEESVFSNFCPYCGADMRGEHGKA